MPFPSEKVKQIEGLLALGELEEALNVFAALPGAGSAVQLQARYAAYRKKVIGQTATHESLTVERNQIFESLQEALREPIVAAVVSDAIFISKLPNLPPHFCGREPELQLLNDAWANPASNIVSFVAPGGTGKTTIINEWLDRLPKHDSGSPDRIFAWSFYSQGTSDQRQSSSDLFMQDALRFFGVDTMPAAPHERGVVLARAVRESRSLLLLDGLEPLQYPPGPVGGELKDPALKALLKELAFDNPGLCVVTTRIAVKEIEGRSAAFRRDLQNLDVPTGVVFLKKLEVKGSQKDLETAVAEFKGHALALRLLGNYLSEFLEGDIRRRDRIPHLTDDEQDGGHAKRVMEAYVAWFGADAPEIALLHLLGLFDRPCPAEALNALLADSPIVGLTDALKKLSPEKWRLALNHLSKLGLLEENRLSDAAIDKSLPYLPALRRTESLDAHPLVREHFGARQQAQSPDAWREAHSRLYEYYKNLPEKELPDTLDEMEPLFYAIAHGCRAGKQQEALDEVYWERVSRGKGYLFNQLGAFGSEITVLSYFFERVWDKPSGSMTEETQAVVLSWTGFALRALGRLREAAKPIKASLELAVEKKEWKSAAARACNLSELYLTAGNIMEAVKYGQLSVQYADQSGDSFEMESDRTAHANALHQSGNLEAAAHLFVEAEAMQQKRQPEYRYLYSLQGYQYCNMLLSFGKYEEVLERAKTTLEWTTLQNWLLDIALDKLSLGCAHFAIQQAENTPSPEAEKWLNEAVEGLRKAGAVEFVATGLLARAAWHGYEGRYAEAYQDLQELLEIAESGGMRLYLVDYHIEMARLLSQPHPQPLPRMGGEQDAAWHKAEALRLIGETGYKRRLKEAEAL